MTHHWGYVSGILSALLVGLGTCLNKIVLAETHPILVAGLIYLFAGVSLSLIRLLPFGNKIMLSLGITSKSEVGMNKKDLIVLALVMFSGAVIAPFLFLNGLNQTTAINASLLQNTESLFTVLIAFSFLKERANRREWAGILLLTLGAIFLTTNAAFDKLTLTQSLYGNILIVLGGLFWGIDNNLSKFLSQNKNLLVVTALKCLTGGTILVLLAQALGLEFHIALTALPYLAIAGAFGIGFSILLFLVSLRKIGAMKTGVIFSTSSLFGAAFAFLILRESFSAIQLVAGSVMLIGIYIIYKK